MAVVQKGEQFQPLFLRDIVTLTNSSTLNLREQLELEEGGLTFTVSPCNFQLRRKAHVLIDEVYVTLVGASPQDRTFVTLEVRGWLCAAGQFGGNKKKLLWHQHDEHASSHKKNPAGGARRAGGDV